MGTKLDPQMASRLCAACGLCCNGVLFREVHLQPEDSISAIAALGLRLRSRHGKRYFQQPCSEFRGSCCSIYDERPVRCREFECRQLQKVAEGEIDESTALETIQRALELVEQVERLVEKCGAKNLKRTLRQRFEKATSEPVSLDDVSGGIEDRARLMRSFSELMELCEDEFRVYEEE